MASRIPFGYGEFYDYPRMIDFELGGEWFFMRSYFEEEKDDYNDFYDVYLLPFHSKEEFQANPTYWMDLSKATHLGRIPIGEIGLDDTRRRTIDGEFMEKWLSARKEESRA